MKRNSVYLRSISCKGVKSPIPFTKPAIYARVSLAGTSKKTGPDAKNGENPEWDCQMNFELTEDNNDESSSLLKIDLTDQSTLLPDVNVGTVFIPVADLVHGGGSGGRASYQVKTCEGKANGTIHIWYRSDGTESESEAQFSPQQTVPPPRNFPYQPTLEPYQAYLSSSPNPNNLFPNSYTSPLTNPNPTNSIYPPPSNPINSIYPPPTTIYSPVPPPAFASNTSYYPQPETRYPPVESQSNYYPQVNQVGESIYYPPSETRSCDCRELSDPDLSYGASNGFYPPPPTSYPYY